LLDPFLQNWPEPLATILMCPSCRTPRFVSNPREDQYIMETGELCTYCEADRTIKWSDLHRSGLHAGRLAKEIARALDFLPLFHEDHRPPSVLLPLGSIQHDGASMPVVLLFSRSLTSINLDAMFPNRMPHVVLHLEAEQSLIAALQDRRMIPLYLPFLVEPVAGGSFKAKKTLPSILRNYASWPEATNALAAKTNVMMETLLDEVKSVPLRTVALLPYGRKKTMRVPGTVTEEGFTASAHFISINWEGRSYTLSKGAARIVETLYIAHRSLGLPGMNQQEVFAQIYGSDTKQWPSGKTRIQNFFRTGDAKKLWDDGFILHDSKGNFRLKLNEVAVTAPV